METTEKEQSFSSPRRIYQVWIILFVIFGVFIPILSIGHSGGEQMPFTLLSYAVNYLVYGLLIISAITPIFFRAWFKRYWYIPVLTMLIAIFLILSVFYLNGNLPKLW